MGYYLQAFICKQSDTNVLTDSFDKAKAILLGQGISLIPLTEDLFEQINNFSSSNSIEKFEFLTENMEQEILKVIGDRKIAYVEAEYFGGEGAQQAIVWKYDKREYFLPYEQERINQVLKDFGVVAKNGEDEFITLGFGLRRHTREWFEEQ